MTEAMPFLQKAILLSYDPWPFTRGHAFMQKGFTENERKIILRTER